METAQGKLEWINKHFDMGHNVVVSTMTRQTKFKPKHRDMFKVKGERLYAQYGRQWLCIDYCGFQATN